MRNKWQPYLFWILLAFLAIGFVFPATRLFVDRLRRNVLLAACVAALALNEVAFFSLQVIPFYRSGLFAR
jgi:hypothetical protein